MTYYGHASVTRLITFVCSPKVSTLMGVAIRMLTDLSIDSFHSYAHGRMITINSIRMLTSSCLLDTRLVGLHVFMRDAILCRHNLLRSNRILSKDRTLATHSHAYRVLPLRGYRLRLSLLYAHDLSAGAQVSTPIIIGSSQTI